MLKLSKITDYGLLCAVYLARHGGRTVSAREISGFYSLPLPVISKVLKTLHDVSIIASQRGVGGGYVFHGDSDTITLGRLIEVFEGPWNLLDCESLDGEGHAICSVRSCCPSRSFIGGINRTIKESFDRVTLADLARGADPQLLMATNAALNGARRETL